MAIYTNVHTHKLHMYFIYISGIHKNQYMYLFSTFSYNV